MSFWRFSSRGFTVALALAGTLTPVASGPALLHADPLPDRELELRRDRVLDDPTLQTELPGWEEAGVQGGHDRDPERRTQSAAREGRDRDWRLPNLPAAALLGTVGEIFQWALLALGGVALVVLLAWLALQLLPGSRGSRARRRLDGSEDDSPEDAGDGAFGDRSLLDSDLDTLLREGEYGAAVHLLLLRAVRLLSRRRGRIPAGHTSREVLAASRLEPAAQGALGELVAAVERSLFGGRRLEREDFQRCQDAFGRLRSGLEGAPEAAEGGP